MRTGGNMLIYFLNETANSVTVLNSSLVNEAWLGGGIILLSAFFCTSKVESSCIVYFTLLHSMISHNKGIVGGGLYMQVNSTE